jgi:hypothetical protein
MAPQIKTLTDSYNLPLVVSVIRYEAPVGKCYGYKDGEVTKAASHRSKKAVGETHALQPFEDFTALRKSLTAEYMLVSGTFETIGEVPVVYKGVEKTGEISASKKFLAHREQPGILIGDIDFKDPDEVSSLHLCGDQPYETKEAALSALSTVLPEADGSALLIGWSTSSNLFKGCCQTNANWSQYRPGDTRFMPKVDAIRPALRRGFV